MGAALRDDAHDPRVLATNVLLSALLSPQARQSLPKFKAVLQPHCVRTMVNNLQRAPVLDRLPTDIEADDPFDAFLLAMVGTGEADDLVTGDRRAGAPAAWAFRTL